MSKDDHWLNNSVVSRIAGGPGFESRSGHDFFLPCDIFTLGAICYGLLKNLHAPAEDRTGDSSISSLALYHVAIKAGLYRKAVQVCDIPNLSPVTQQ